MDNKKGVINECILVAYSAGRDNDGDSVLLTSRSYGNNTAAVMNTFHGEKADLIYSELLKLVTIGRTIKEEIEE